MTRSLHYMAALARNLILYGRMTVWVALPRDGFWFDDARIWYKRGYIPYIRLDGGSAEIKPDRTLWQWIWHWGRA